MIEKNQSETVTYAQTSVLSGGGRNGLVEMWSKAIEVPAASLDHVQITDSTLRVKFFTVAANDKQAIADANAISYVDQSAKAINDVNKTVVQQYVVADDVLSIMSLAKTVTPAGPQEKVGNREELYKNITDINNVMMIVQQTGDKRPPSVAVCQDGKKLYVSHPDKQVADVFAAGTRSGAISNETTVINKHKQVLSPK